MYASQMHFLMPNVGEDDEMMKVCWGGMGGNFYLTNRTAFLHPAGIFNVGNQILTSPTGPTA